LCNWREQLLSRQSDLHSGATWEVGVLLYGGGPASDFIFVPSFVNVVGLRFIWYTLYMEVSVQHRFRPIYLWYPLDEHLDGPQTPSGSGDEKKIPDPTGN
jgi:hypothetical protein